MTIEDVLYLNHNKVVKDESYLEMNSPSSLEKLHLELKYVCFLYQAFHKTEAADPSGSSTFMGISFSI